MSFDAEPIVPTRATESVTRLLDLTPPEQAKVQEAFRRAGLTLRTRTPLVVNGQPTRELAAALRTLTKEDMDQSFETLRYGVNRRTYRGMLPKTEKHGSSRVDFIAMGKAEAKKRRKKAKRLREQGGTA